MSRFLAFLLFLVPGILFAEDAFEMESVVLLNPMSEFEERTEGAQIIGGYINSVRDKLAPIVNNTYAEDPAARDGIVAVAVRPGHSSKHWIDIDGQFQPKLSAELEKAMTEVGTPKVVGGPIAFILNFQIWGGVKVDEVEVNEPALPAVWKEAADKHEGKPLFRVPDDILLLVWPVSEDDAPKNAFAFVPEGFVKQSLDPIGGTVLRPKDWHFSTQHRPNTLDWVISKEPSAGGYITGMRIQLFVGVKEATKQTPEELVKSIVQAKKMSGKVLSEREAEEVGVFTRIGLEVEQPQDGKDDAQPFRILYSCFWANELDMVAISVTGTTTDLWDKYEPTFDTMRGFTLFDPAHAKLSPGQPEK